MSFDTPESNGALQRITEALGAVHGWDQQRIAQVGVCVVGMLLEKNAAYGSSAFEPISIFAKGDALEQIHVRMDDKLARLSKGHALSDESLADTVFDLAGYCVLELIAQERVDAAPPRELTVTAERAGEIETPKAL